uniref:ZAD domain-containing protein n=2 Tax=Timema TaxID=61471 RepID=A0A7R9PP21_TIMGE|nr:unnamed protein product [Timema genevievae]
MVGSRFESRPGVLRVKEDDNMPKQICLSCLNRLDSSYELYARCVSAQATIKRLLDAADKGNPAPGSTHLDWAPSSKVNFRHSLGDKFCLLSSVLKVRNSGLQLSGPSIMKIGSSVVKLQDYLMGPGDDEPQPKVMRLQESPDFSRLVQSSILLGEEGSGDMLGAKPETPGSSTISFNQQHPVNTISQSSQGLGLRPQEDPPHFLEAVTMTPEQFMEMGSSQAQSSQQLAGGAQIMVTIPPSNTLLRRSAGVASPISKNDLPATVAKLQNLGSSKLDTIKLAKFDIVKLAEFDIIKLAKFDTIKLAEFNTIKLAEFNIIKLAEFGTIKPAKLSINKFTGLDSSKLTNIFSFKLAILIKAKSTDINIIQSFVFFNKFTSLDTAKFTDINII